MFPTIFLWSWHQCHVEVHVNMVACVKPPNLLPTAILVLLSAYLNSADVQLRHGKKPLILEN